MGLILDTNFIITAEREARHRVAGRTDRFLASRPNETLFITFAELACGQSASLRLDWESAGPIVARKLGNAGGAKGPQFHEERRKQ